MRTPTLLLPLLLATAVAAQTTSSLSTETDFGVFGAIGTAAALQAVAKNTPVAAGVPLNLAVQARGVAAATTVGLSASGPVVTVASSAAVLAQVTNGIAGTAATTVPRNVVQAPHSLLFTIQNPAFRSIDVTLLSTVGGRLRTAAQVDVGADGSVEFDQLADGQPHRRTLPISGAQVTIRITVNGSVPAGGSYDLQLVVGPSTGGCLLAGYGVTCPATTLSGADRPTSTSHVIGLQVANALPSAPVVLVVGSMPTRLQLPASPCFLLTNDLALVGMVADAAGNAATQAVFPLSVQGTGFLQAIPYDPALRVIFSSNGLRVDCF